MPNATEPTAAGLRRPRSRVIPALLVVFAGCTAPAPWPDPPSSEGRSAVSRKPCPAIAGIYTNAAETSRSCSLDAQACSALTFYLFSKHVREAAGVSNFPTPSDDWPAGTHVRIEQPTPDILRIVSLDGSSPMQSRVLASRELLRQHGDFDCESGNVRLQPKVERDFQLWFGRRTNTEYLALNGDADGLVLHSTRQYASYLMWLVGGTMREESDTLRWPKAR